MAPSRGASDPLAALDGLESKKLTFQDALTKRLTHLVGDQARNNIRRAACREGYHHGSWPGGISVLCQRRRGKGEPCCKRDKYPHVATSYHQRTSRCGQVTDFSWPR